MAKIKVVELENYTDQFVPVFPTKDNPFHEQGKKVMLHPDVAKKLIQKGLMTDEVPEDYQEPEEENGSNE
jgi:hypothetical protein